MIPMPDGVRIAVHELGESDAPPLLLVHGFLSNARTNWISPGIAAALAATGHRVIMAELRGHGHSDVPTDAAAYPPDVLPADMEQVVRTLELEQPVLIGYSLGARTVMRMVVRGLRPRALVLGGMGLAGLTDSSARRDWFIDAIARRDSLPPTSPEASVGRFLRQTKTDPDAAMHVLRTQVDSSGADLARVACPCLVICGEKDQDNGSAADLAAAIPGALYAQTPGTHMSAITMPEFAKELTGFVSRF
jgi:pimeloyl-ACP methyl ester carboxylesterase